MTKQQAKRAARKLIERYDLYGWDWPTIVVTYPGIAKALQRLEALRDDLVDVTA